MSEMIRLADLIQHRIEECRNGDVISLLASIDRLAGDHGDLAVRHALAISLQVSEMRRSGSAVRPALDQSAF